MTLAKTKKAHTWKRDSLDWYVEPEWCSERLFEAVQFAGSIIDPACGGGNIVYSANRAGLYARGFDIARRSDAFTVQDFFTLAHRAHNIVSNPPFSRADEFLDHALKLATEKVALLLPLTWLASLKRSKRLAQTPLAEIYVLTPRPSMPPGQYLLDGGARGSGTKDFAWFIWDKTQIAFSPRIDWLRR